MTYRSQYTGEELDAAASLINLHAETHKIQSFTSLSQLGLATGATVQEAFAALPVYGLFQISADTFLESTVPAKGGVVVAYKSGGASRSWIFFHGKSVQVGDYRLSTNDGTVGSRWYKIFTEYDVIPEANGGTGGTSLAAAVQALINSGDITIP